jgi:hypothetical protein
MGVNSEELSDVAVLHVENRIRHIQEQQLYQKKQRTFQLQQAAAQAAAVQAEFQHTQTQTVQELEWLQSLDTMGKTEEFLKVLKTKDGKHVDFWTFFEYMKTHIQNVK